MTPRSLFAWIRLSTFDTLYLLMVAALAIVYMSMFTYLQNHLENRAISYKENVDWAVFQVQKEMLSAIHLSDSLVGAKKVSAEELLDAYEIFVSRVKLISTGDAYRDLRQIESFAGILENLEGIIEDVDGLIYADGINAYAVAQILSANLELIEDDLQRASLATIRFAGEQNIERNSDISRLMTMLEAMFVVSLVLIVLASLALLRSKIRTQQAIYQAREEETTKQLLQQAKLKSLGELAGGIAHEINTPAQFVTSNLDFIRTAYGRICEPNTAPLSDDEAEFFKGEVPIAIDQSQEGMQRIGNIVRAIRYFAHNDTEELVPVDVGEEVRVALILTSNQTKHIVRIETDIASEVPPVLGHVNELNQVLINLIINSVQAIEEASGDDKVAIAAGELRLSVQGDEETVEIRLADNGPGIPDEIVAKVFDPFFTTKPAGIGTGQGLAISKRIVEETFQGTIDIDRGVEQGTTFVIRLPAYRQRESFRRQVA